jgi:hypothetical protein
MWNVILESRKNGVQTFSQFVTGYEMYMYCTFKAFPSLAQVSESFADILQAQAKTPN